MAEDERVAAWMQAVERVLAAAAALKAAIKVYDQGGLTIELAFATCEAARATQLKANAIENAAWKKLVAEPEQQTMDGVRPPKPHEARAPRLLEQGRKPGSAGESE